MKVAPRLGCGGAPPRTPAPDAGDGVGDSGVLRHARRRLTPSRLPVSLRLPHWPASPSFSGGRAATFEGRGRYISLRRARRRLSLTPTVLAEYIASPAQVSWLSIYSKHTGHGLGSQSRSAVAVSCRTHGLQSQFHSQFHRHGDCSRSHGLQAQLHSERGRRPLGRLK
jgi:hypothetical protein